MKPQMFGLDCEALNDFRWAMDAELRRMLCMLEEKGLDAGTLTGKIKIEIVRGVTKDGELIQQIEIKPDVAFKIKEDQKCDLMKKQGIMFTFDANGDPIIATDQISMDEVIEKGA